MTGPNMDTFGQRQARRFKERKGHDRASLHLYRPTRESAQAMSWIKQHKVRWYLDLASARRRLAKLQARHVTE